MRVTSIANWGLSRALAIMTSLSMLLVIPPCVYGAPIFDFTRIADDKTPIPGGPGLFAGFGGPFSTGSSMSNGNLTFVAPGPGDHRGLYRANIDGTLQKLADIAKPVPIQGVTTAFTWFGQPSIHNNTVAFVGSFGNDPPDPFSSVPDTAVFTAYILDGSISKLVDQNTQIPAGSGNFTGFFGSSQSGGNTAFVGFGSGGQQGIYVANESSVLKIVDRDTPVPVHNDPNVTKSLIKHSAPNMSGAILTFCGIDADGNKGIYTATLDGDIQVVADTTTPIPGGTGNFVDFGIREDIEDDGTVTFVGFGTDGQEGVYSNASGVLQVVADINTSIPGGTGNFEHFNFFGGLSISGGNIAFMGAGSDEQGGLYFAFGNSVIPILQHGDVLDGFIIELVQTDPPIPDWWNVIPPISIYTEGLDGNDVAFLVGFSDGSSGIFVATAIPEPSTFALWSIGFLGIIVGGAFKRRCVRYKTARLLKRQIKII